MAEPPATASSEDEQSEIAEEVTIPRMIDEPFEGFLAFEEEAERFHQLIRCPAGEMLPPVYEGDSALYKCVSGASDSIRIFIRNEPDQDAVNTIKILWLAPQALESTQGQESEAAAREVIGAIATFYAPENAEAIEDMFFSDTSQTLDTGELEMEYNYRQEAASNEHLLVIAEK